MTTDWRTEAIRLLQDTWDDTHIVKFQTTVKGMSAKIFKFLQANFDGTLEEFIKEIVSTGLMEAYRDFINHHTGGNPNKESIERFLNQWLGESDEGDKQD